MSSVFLVHFFECSLRDRAWLAIKWYAASYLTKHCFHKDAIDFAHVRKFRNQRNQRP